MLWVAALDWGELPRVFPGAAGACVPVAGEEELKGSGSVDFSYCFEQCSSSLEW